MGASQPGLVVKVGPLSLTFPLKSQEAAPESSRPGVSFLRVLAKWQCPGVWAHERFQISWHIFHEALPPQT